MSDELEEIRMKLIAAAHKKAEAKADADHAEYPRINWDLLAAIQRWVEAGTTPGSFGQALLCNDLSGSFDCADENNLAVLNSIVDYLVWKIPGNTWGSIGIVTAWHNERNHYYTEEAKRILTERAKPHESPPPT